MHSLHIFIIITQVVAITPCSFFQLIVNVFPSQVVYAAKCALMHYK